MEKTTTEWEQYQNGIDYNNRLNYYAIADKNEAFYAGDQWRGVQSNGLPTPVFNLFKRIINYKISTILSQKTTIQFSHENTPDEPVTLEDEENLNIADILNGYTEDLKERIKFDSIGQDILLNASLSGDGGIYSFWNPSIDLGQEMTGDIDIELPDGGNIFFGNPNTHKVQSQPYILISYRELVSKLRDEAKQEGVNKEDIELIVPDDDYTYEAGDRGKIEIDHTKDNATGKTTALIKFWKKTKEVEVRDKLTGEPVIDPMTGKVKKETVTSVHWTKSTRNVTIIKERDTRLSRYPIAWMNWDRRKNSYHGQAEGTGLIPNQIFINKLFAMSMISLQNTAYPRIVYDKSRIGSISNQVGATIGVEGDITNVIDVLKGGDFSPQVAQFIDKTIDYTKDMLGATDAALGDVRPDNTSAIIAVQEASAIPLETIKRNYWQLVEDMAYNWLDYMANYYGIRKVPIIKNGQRMITEFDFSILKTKKFRIKIDVGPSSYWSEIASMQTLDNLLGNGHIDFIEYLERLRDGYIPKRQELIDSRKEQMAMQEEEAQKQAQYEQMAQWLESQPPEIQQQIANLPPEQQEQAILSMMQGAY